MGIFQALLSSIYIIYSIGDKGAEALANSNLINFISLNLNNNSISGSSTAKAIPTSLEQKREMVRISNRLREMEERYQIKLTRLGEENQNKMKDRHQTQTIRLREENQNTIREMEEKLNEES
jgi:hypothetical protein